MICENNCPICFESLENVTVCTTKCNHKYCTPCFIRHMSNPKSNGFCPLCRHDLMDEALLEALESISIENKNNQSNISFDDVTLLLSMNELNNDHDYTSVADLSNSQGEYGEYELEEGEILEETQQETINIMNHPTTNPASDSTTNSIISGIEVIDPLDFICDLHDRGSEIDSIDLIETAHEIAELSMDIAELSMSNIELDHTTETVTYTIDRNPMHPPFDLISAIESIHATQATQETSILDHLPDTVTVRN